MRTTSDQPDIAKPHENLMFLLIFEGLRLTGALSGSRRKLRRKLLAQLLAG